MVVRETNKKRVDQLAILISRSNVCNSLNCLVTVMRNQPLWRHYSTGRRNNVYYTQRPDLFLYNIWRLTHYFVSSNCLPPIRTKDWCRTRDGCIAKADETENARQIDRLRTFRARSVLNRLSVVCLPEIIETIF